MVTRKPAMKIEVRSAEPADFEAVRAIFEGEHAIGGTLQTPFPSAEGWRKLLADIAPTNKVLVAVANGRVVGQIGVHQVARPRRSHVAIIGMAVHDRWQGRGVGRALMAAAIDLADNWLQLLRLELTVFTDNPAARGLYEKFGFQLEGTHRAYALRDGVFVDAHAMARLHPNPPSLALPHMPEGPSAAQSAWTRPRRARRAA